jgi:hypothetical protein
VGCALCRIFGHQPQKTGGLKAVLCINFLNNSSSSWEVMMEPWPVEVLLSNPINRMFKDRRTTWVMGRELLGSGLKL